MDADRIKGTARTMAGTVEEQYGRLTGDEQSRADGVAQRVAGRAQDALGQAKDGFREAAERASLLAEDAYDQGRLRVEQSARAINGGIEANPVMAILVASAIGYLCGILAGRRRH